MSNDMDDLPQEAHAAAPSSGSDFPVLPKDDYQAVVYQHEVKVKEGEGKIHAFTFAITQGEFRGQKQFKSLKFFHPDPKEREKANGFFGSLKAATGYDGKRGGAGFIDRKCTIAVKVMTPKDGGDSFNYVANVKPPSDGSPTMNAILAPVKGGDGAAQAANPFGSVV
jgi:hypothetical protein